MPEPSDETREPVTFGKYLLDEELARGGMSRVFRARLQGPGGFEKKLVVKQILPELAADPSFIELFVQEANTLVQLSHPNLVPVYELGVVDGVYFLAMEWVQGATVDQLLGMGPLPAGLAVQIGAQIAEALHYAHERFSIVHRDVTPRNIIVDATGHARLLDFGIAAHTEHTGRGELFGSPGYMSPEQLRGEKLGAESDLFSLGSVLYEAISGTSAWSNARSAADFAAIRAPTAVAHADAQLSALILGLLATEPSTRPQPASLVADRLRTWLAEHHPRGVLPDAADRVLRAQAQASAEPQAHAKTPRENSGRIEVRSIAVNPQLTELLRHATERLERPVAVLANTEHTPSRPPVPVTHDIPLADDPEAKVVARRFFRDIVIVSLALMAALLYARFYDEPRLMGQVPERGITNTRTAPAPRSADTDTRPAPTPNEAPPPTAAEPAVAPLSPDPASAAPAPVAPTEAPSKRGSLSVSATPWAEVRVDGRLLGTTPRRSLPLRAGKHTLSLSCPPLAHETQLPIDVAAGQELHVSANMHESPPQITIH
ncbi:MAG: hypothetical protein RL701_3635 [Pseudomonadota bacterium]